MGEETFATPNETKESNAAVWMDYRFPHRGNFYS